MFTDKSKSISLSLLFECQPDSELDNGDDDVDHEVDICSKCNTNYYKRSVYRSGNRDVIERLQIRKLHTW